MDDRISLRSGAPPPDAYFRLFQTTGWNALYRIDIEELERAVARSWACVGAYEGDSLVGVGRLLSDGALYAVMFDVIVAPDRQRRGLGTRIVRALLETCDEAGIRDVLLFSARGTEAFYRRFGFVPRPAEAPGMILRRMSPRGS